MKLEPNDILRMCAAMPYTIAMFQQADGATVRLLGWIDGTRYAVESRNETYSFTNLPEAAEFYCICIL